MFNESDGALGFMQDIGIWLLAIFGMVIITAYGFVFLKRGIRYLKMIESKYIDESILDFLEIAIKVIWALLVFFTSLMMLALAFDWFWNNVWVYLTDYPGTGGSFIAPFMSGVIVIVILGLCIKFLHHILQYQAGNLKEKPEKPMNPRIALLIEIFMKYFLIAFGVIIVITIGLTAIGYYYQIVGGMTDWLVKNNNSLIFVIFIIIIGYFIKKVLETFFEDMKKKETPFSPQIMDVFKTVTKYVIYLLVGIIVIYSLLQMFALGQTGIIIVGIIIVFIGLLVAVAATSNLRNGFSGIILMAFKPFDEGDRIKILENQVCDVISLGIMFTRVRTLRGEVMDIPNNEILNRPILNYSKSDDYAISITVTVPHDVHKGKMKESLISAALNTDGILQNLTPEVLAIGKDDDKLVLEVLAYTITPRRLKHIKSDLIHRINDDLKERGIPHSVHIADDEEQERMKAVRGQELKREWHGL